MWLWCSCSIRRISRASAMDEYGGYHASWPAHLATEARGSFQLTGEKFRVHAPDASALRGRTINRFLMNKSNGLRANKLNSTRFHACAVLPCIWCHMKSEAFAHRPSHTGHIHLSFPSSSCSQARRHRRETIATLHAAAFSACKVHPLRVKHRLRYRGI